jgi:hypothetical protein
MVMIGKVGYWPYANVEHRGLRGLAVDFDDCMAEWADTLPTSDRRVCFEVTTDRKLVIKPCATGIPVTFSRNKERRACSSKSLSPEGLKLAIELPLFQLHEVVFKEVGENLVGELMPDHELPWPSIYTLKAADNPMAIAKEAVEIRIISLVASGLSNFGKNAVPSHIRSYVSHTDFAEIRRTAIALSGVLKNA